MGTLEMVVVELTQDFKNYPELQKAWENLLDQQEDIFERWSKIIGEALIEYSGD